MHSSFFAHVNISTLCIYISCPSILHTYHKIYFTYLPYIYLAGTATAEFATSEEADLVVAGLTNTPVDGITVVAVRDTELRLNNTTEAQANGTQL